MPLICQCGCGQEIPPSPVHGKKGYYVPTFIRGHANRTSAYRAQAAAKAAERVAMQPVLICQCGCGEPIPPKASHRRRPPKYILSHYLKLGAHPRIQRMKEEQAKRRIAPPADWSVPDGLCGCGCGRATKIASVSKPYRDQYAGYPLRFLNGHNGRLLTGERASGWRGGRVTRQGYIWVHAPDEPGAYARDGYILEHRLVYQRTRGVILPRHVEVHHINGVRDDNRPENLMASAKGEHKRTHAFANALISFFLDARLNEAAVAHVRAYGTVPDIAELTQQVHGAHAAT